MIAKGNRRSESSHLLRPQERFMRDGQFTQVDVPGSTYTDVEGINDAGVLGGIYLDASNKIHSFLRFGPNPYRTVEFPGSDYTAVNGLNNRLELTGQMSPPFVSA